MTCYYGHIPHYWRFDWCLQTRQTLSPKKNHRNCCHLHHWHLSATSSIYEKSVSWRAQRVAVSKTRNFPIHRASLAEAPRQICWFACCVGHDLQGISILKKQPPWPLAIRNAYPSLDSLQLLAGQWNIETHCYCLHKNITKLINDKREGKKKKIEDTLFSLQSVLCHFPSNTTHGRRQRLVEHWCWVSWFRTWKSR